MIKAVCFDVHDTLIDKGRPMGLMAAKKSAALALSKKFNHINGDIMEQAWKRCQVIAREMHKEGREISAPEWYGEMLRSLGIDRFDDNLMREFNAAFMSGFRPFTTLLPGARETLMYLSAAGYKLAAVSNSLGTNTRIDLEVTGLTGFFDHIVISSEFGWRKPHPEIFRRVLELLEVEPHETVFVGDNPKEDIIGAAGAGMHAVMVRRVEDNDRDSYERINSELEQSGFPVPVLDSLLGLGDLIDKL